MPRRRSGAAILLTGGLLGVLAACGGGSTAPTTNLDRDCSTLTSATVRLRLVDPDNVTPKQIQDNIAAVERLQNSSDALISEQMLALQNAVTPTAVAYVAALRAGQTERAVALEGTLRRKAVPIARTCGLQPAQVYGLPANR
jgi:hypothetical protein